MKQVRNVVIIIVLGVLFGLVLATTVEAQTIENSFGSMTVEQDRIAYATPTINQTVNRDILEVVKDDYLWTVEDLRAILQVETLLNGEEPVFDSELNLANGDSLRSAVDSLMAAVVEGETYMQQLRDNNDTLVAENSTLNDQVVVLNDSLTYERAQYAMLEANVDQMIADSTAALNTEITALTSDLSSANDQIVSLTLELDNLNNVVVVQQQRILDIIQRIYDSIYGR